jgi:hypothetical protein
MGNNNPSLEEVDERLTRSQSPEPTDGLSVCERASERLRDLELRKEQLQEELKQVNIAINKLQFEDLPRTFEKYGQMSAFELRARGNLPAMRVSIEDYYRANIVANWKEERREKAFKFLEKRGLGDLIKHELVVHIGLGEKKLYERVVKALSRVKGAAVMDVKSVPWNTLTAWLKEHYESGGELGTDELDLIGGTVGKQVIIKSKKER